MGRLSAVSRGEPVTSSGGAERRSRRVRVLVRERWARPRQKRFFAKARPDWVLRYRSKATALVLSRKATAVSIRQGANFDVCGTLRALWALRRSARFSVTPTYQWPGGSMLWSMYTYQNGPPMAIPWRLPRRPCSPSATTRQGLAETKFAAASTAVEARLRGWRRYDAAVFVRLAANEDWRRRESNPRPVTVQLRFLRA